MKLIEIKSPEIKCFDTKNGLICKISHQMYQDENLGVYLPVNHSVFMNLTEKSKNGKFKLPFDENAIFDKAVVERMHKIKSKIGQCSQIAETLFSKLKNCNNLFKSEEVLSELFEKVEDKYYKLGFMNHRNLLSEIFKSKKIDWLEEILSVYNVKSITKSFYAFIIDRNKYTHGELMYWYPERKTILEYMNESNTVEYGVVNQDVLNSFLNCYKELNELLDKIITTYNSVYKK